MFYLPSISIKYRDIEAEISQRENSFMATIQYENYFDVIEAKNLEDLSLEYARVINQYR